MLNFFEGKSKCIWMAPSIKGRKHYAVYSIHVAVCYLTIILLRVGIGYDRYPVQIFDGLLHSQNAVHNLRCRMVSRVTSLGSLVDCQHFLHHFFMMSYVIHTCMHTLRISQLSEQDEHCKADR